MADRQPDDVRLDFLERAKVPIAGVECYAGSSGNRLVAARLAERRREIRAPSREARLDGNVREMLGGERIAIALERRPQEHARELSDIAGPAVAHEERKCVIPDRERLHADLLDNSVEEVPCERGDVAAA